MAKRSNKRNEVATAIVKKKAKSDALSTAIIHTAVDIKEFDKLALPLIRKLDNLVINNQDNYDKAGEYVKKLKELKKSATVKEKSITDPLETAKKNTKALFSPFYERVDEAEETTKQAMLEYREKQRKVEEKINKDFETKKIKNISTWADKVSKAKVTSSTSSTRLIKKLEVVDAKKIPREFLVPDLRAIEAHLKDGGTVAGCKLIEVESIAI